MIGHIIEYDRRWCCQFSGFTPVLYRWELGKWFCGLKSWYFMVVILVSAYYYYFFSLPFAEARRRNNNSLNFMSYVVWFMGNINSISIKPVVVLGSTEWRFFFSLILHE